MGTAPSRELIEKARNGEAAGSEADFAWDFAVLDKRQKFMLRRKVEGRGSGAAGKTTTISTRDVVYK